VNRADKCGPLKQQAAEMVMTAHQHEPQKLAYQINEAVRVSGLSRTTLYELMKTGQLKTVLVAGRRLVPAENLKALLSDSNP